MKKRFGGKVYRLSLSSGCSCPNRTDGSGGCIFCSEGGSGEFASDAILPIKDQLESAKLRVSRKLSKNFAGYCAYFQSFSNTYAPVSVLEPMFTEALEGDDILMLSIATRPDCLGDDILDMLSRLAAIKPLMVELGLQTSRDDTAVLINRGYATSVYDEAVARLHSIGAEVVTHMIVGLPGETRDDAIATVRHIKDAGSDGVKIQMLQVLKGTRLARDLSEGRIRVISDPGDAASGELCLTGGSGSALSTADTPTVFNDVPSDSSHGIIPYSLEAYTDILLDILKILPPEMVIHRMTGDPPKSLLISPEWTADKKRVLNYINARVRMA
jgi:uncharacterized protein